MSQTIRSAQFKARAASLLTASVITAFFAGLAYSRFSHGDSTNALLCCTMALFGLVLAVAVIVPTRSLASEPPSRVAMPRTESVTGVTSDKVPVYVSKDPLSVACVTDALAEQNIPFVVVGEELASLLSFLPDSVRAVIVAKPRVKDALVIVQGLVDASQIDESACPNLAVPADAAKGPPRG